MKTDIIGLIDKYITGQNARRTASYNYTAHHPSSINKCQRQLYYKWTNAEITNPSSAASLLRMGAGDALHGQIQSILRSILPSMVECYVELEREDLTYPIRGRLDGLFIMPRTGEVAAIELKTTYGAGVKRIKEDGLPREDAMLQAFTYFNLPLSEGMAFKEPCINKLYLIYMGRDNFYRTQFELYKYKDKYYVDGKEQDYDFERIVSGLKRFELAFEGRNIPDRGYEAAFRKYKGQTVMNISKTPWQCRPDYCPYSDLCWGEMYERDNEESPEFF